MPGRILRVAPVLIVTLVVTWQAATVLQQDLAYTRPQTEVSFWGRDAYQPDTRTIKATGNTIATLVKGRPGHPEYLALQANYSSWQAYRAQTMEERMAYGRQAVNSQMAAQQSRPAHRHGWQKVIEYASRTTDGEALLNGAKERLQALQSG